MDLTASSGDELEDWKYLCRYPQSGLALKVFRVCPAASL